MSQNNSVDSSAPLSKIAELLDKAEGKKIHIRGYRNSEGVTQQEMVVVTARGGAYRRLIAESIAELPKFAGISPLHREVCNELKSKWEETLREQKPAKITVGENHSQGGMCMVSADKVALVSVEDVSGGVKTAGKPGKTDKDNVRNEITRWLPIGRYIPRINLAPGKFDTLWLSS